jgi:hypothetical protein
MLCVGLTVALLFCVHSASASNDSVFKKSEPGIEIGLASGLVPAVSSTDAILNVAFQIRNLTDHQVVYLDASYYHGIFLYSIDQQGNLMPIFPFDPLKIKGGFSHVLKTVIPPRGTTTVQIKFPADLLYNVKQRRYQVSVEQVLGLDPSKRFESRAKVFSKPFDLPNLQ